MEATKNNAHGFRLSTDGHFTPLFSAPVESYTRELSAAVKEYPYLRYNDEILTEIQLLCVTGEFFGRAKEETWILDDQIKTLRGSGRVMHTDDAENFAIAIEMFLHLQLAGDYDKTSKLFEAL